MGIDASIFFTWTGVREAILELPEGYTIEKLYSVDFMASFGATHEVENDFGARYYDVGYERGDWEIIAPVLKTLLDYESISQVWYESYVSMDGTECGLERAYNISLEPLSLSRFNKIQKYFITQNLLEE